MSHLSSLLSLYVAEGDDFYWRCHRTKLFAPITHAMPLAVFVPNLVIRTDMGKAEHLMDTNATRFG